MSARKYQASLQTVRDYLSASGFDPLSATQTETGMVSETWLKMRRTKRQQVVIYGYEGGAVTTVCACPNFHNAIEDVIRPEGQEE